MIWALGFYWRIRRPMVALLGWRGYLKAIWRTEREVIEFTRRAAS